MTEPIVSANSVHNSWSFNSWQNRNNGTTNTGLSSHQILDLHTIAILLIPFDLGCRKLAKRMVHQELGISAGGHKSFDLRSDLIHAIGGIVRGLRLNLHLFPSHATFQALPSWSHRNVFNYQITLTANHLNFIATNDPLAPKSVSIFPNLRELPFSSLSIPYKSSPAQLLCASIAVELLPIPQNLSSYSDHPTKLTHRHNILRGEKHEKGITGLDWPKLDFLWG